MLFEAAFENLHHCAKGSSIFLTSEAATVLVEVSDAIHDLPAGFVVQDLACGSSVRHF